MKSLLLFVVWMCSLYINHGLLGFYSLLFRVNWSQDINMINGGHDLITLSKSGYFTGTYWERNCFFESLNKMKINE